MKDKKEICLLTRRCCLFLTYAQNAKHKIRKARLHAAALAHTLLGMQDIQKRLPLVVGYFGDSLASLLKSL